MVLCFAFQEADALPNIDTQEAIRENKERGTLTHLLTRERANLA